MKKTEGMIKKDLVKETIFLFIKSIGYF